MIHYSRPKVLIVSAGRSGSSTVARICHEKLGINMGRFLKPPGPANPEGFYEDYVSHGLVRVLAAGAMHPEEYMAIMTELCGKKWGSKDAWFLKLSDEQLRRLSPDLAIFCWRDPELCVDSWCRIKGEKTRQDFQRLVYERRARLEYLNILGLWENQLNLFFNHAQSETMLEQEIREELG